VRPFEDVTGVPFWFLTDHDSPGFTGLDNGNTPANFGQCGTFWGGDSAANLRPGVNPEDLPQCPSFDWSSPNGKALLANGTKQLKAAATTFCAPFVSELPPYSCEMTAPTPYSKSFALGMSYTSSFYALFTLVGPILAGMLVAKGRMGDDATGHKRMRGMSALSPSPDAAYSELSDSKTGGLGTRLLEAVGEKEKAAL
jgi:hypothetical protein